MGIPTAILNNKGQGNFQIFQQLGMSENTFAQ